MQLEEITGVHLFFEEAEGPYCRAIHENIEIRIEFGDFPPEPLYTVYIDGRAVYSGDHLPSWRWEIQVPTDE